MGVVGKLLEKWACKHDWDVMYNMEIYDTYEVVKSKNSNKEPIPSGVRRTLVCKNCGKIKQVNL